MLMMMVVIVIWCTPNGLNTELLRYPHIAIIQVTVSVIILIIFVIVIILVIIYILPIIITITTISM